MRRTVRRRSPLWAAIAVALLAAALEPLLFAAARDGQMSALGRAVLAIWRFPLLAVGNLELSTERIVETGLLLAFLWYCAKATTRALRTGVLDRTRLNGGQKLAIQRTVGYTLWSLGATVGLQAIGFDVSSLAVAGGAVAFCLSLGARTVVKQFTAGLVILFERHVRVGDRVAIGDLRGDIVRVGAISTAVRTNANLVLTVPNSQLIETRVANWTANDRIVRVTVPLRTSYDAEPEQVRNVLLSAASACRDVLSEPAHEVALVSLGGGVMTFELRVWTSNPRSLPPLKDKLYVLITAAFKREGIEIPFPQRDIACDRPEGPLGRRAPIGSTSTG